MVASFLLVEAFRSLGNSRILSLFAPPLTSYYTTSAAFPLHYTRLLLFYTFFFAVVVVVAVYLFVCWLNFKLFVLTSLMSEIFKDFDFLNA